MLLFSLNKPNSRRYRAGPTPTSPFLSHILRIRAKSAVDCSVRQTWVWSLPLPFVSSYMMTSYLPSLSLSFLICIIGIKISTSRKLPIHSRPSRNFSKHIVGTQEKFPFETGEITKNGPTASLKVGGGCCQVQARENQFPFLLV